MVNETKRGTGPPTLLPVPGTGGGGTVFEGDEEGIASKRASKSAAETLPVLTEPDTPTKELFVGAGA